jgi:thiamine transporter ThiT
VLCRYCSLYKKVRQNMEQPLNLLLKRISLYCVAVAFLSYGVERFGFHNWAGILFWGAFIVGAGCAVVNGIQILIDKFR